MQSFGIRVFEQQEAVAQEIRGLARRGGTSRGQAGIGLRAIAAVMLTLAAGVPSGFAQQAGSTTLPPDKAASQLPAAPTPTPTEPLNLRSTQRDFSKPAGRMIGDPINMYRPTTIAKANFANSVRLADLVKNGKMYLSLSDAIALALENNFDIAIARYNLDIADTDILRARAGGLLGEPLGVNTGIVSNTLGGSSSTLTAGGGPGGTTVGSGGAGSGTSGLSLTAQGAGPYPETLDPTVGASIELQRQEVPQSSLFSPASSTNTDAYNFTYNQGFVTGAALTVGFNNSRLTTNSPYYDYSPLLSSSFTATVTQHLLQGAGIWVNKRFMYQALNTRRITDSSFRQQILFTVNQVENIYWVLVSAYEDVQAKERQLDQSTKLDSDDKKQLEIGTVAPLQVVSDDASVAADQQALMTSQNNLNYQQLIIKQAIARNLNDPELVAAAVIPTDRVSLEELPEEKQPVEDLVQLAFRQRPELEQAVLTLRNDEITMKGARNALLPILDAYAFYGATASGGSQSPDCVNLFSATGGVCPPGTVPNIGYGTTLSDLVNSSGPDKGVGFNVTLPIRNRQAQSVQARSLMEYRQAELRLEQIHTQIRMQVVNAQLALANDRAQVLSARASQDYAQQSVDAENKKLHLGASTTANVLLMQRNLATAENTLIADNAAYAKDRAGLYQILASTLQHYGINLNDAATGIVNAAPVVPGLEPAKPGKEPSTVPPPSQ
jgi:outer membrane protein TolC